LRIVQLTFTRYLAALAILVYHFAQGLTPFDLPFIEKVTKSLNIGVSYFFVLSGFVMVIAYHNSRMDTVDRNKYFVNRIARIYPVYLFALLTLTGFYAYFGGRINANSFILGSLALQSWFPTHALSLNTPGWSICVEVLFYTLFPLLIVSYRKYSLNHVLWVVLVLWLLSQVVFIALFNSEYNQGLRSGFYKLIFYNPLMHMNEFTIGNAAALLFLKYRGYAVRNAGAWAFFAVLLTFGLILFKPDYLAYHNGLLAPLFAVFIFLLSMDKGKLYQLLSHRWLVYAGEINYSLYILQLPFYKLWTAVFDKLQVDNPYFLFYGYVVALTLVSAASYELLEKKAKAYITLKMAGRQSGTERIRTGLSQP